MGLDHFDVLRGRGRGRLFHLRVADLVVFAVHGADSQQVENRSPGSPAVLAFFLQTQPAGLTRSFALVGRQRNAVLLHGERSVSEERLRRSNDLTARHRAVSLNGGGGGVSAVGSELVLIRDASAGDRPGS